MPIYEFERDAIIRLTETSFDEAGLQERRDLQRLLREHVEVISPDTLVISEEFGEWDASKHRIDLLGIDTLANLVVIELKRTEDGGYMELQAIRYAAMVSTMTFDQCAAEYGRYLKRMGRGDQDPNSLILEFLHWDEPDEDRFAQDVRIILASAEFSRELTSSVLWLIQHDVDIRCVRLKPYRMHERLLVDVQQIIPLPEAAEYQVQVREKARKERHARDSSADFTRFDIQFEDKRYPNMWKRNAIFAICRHLCERGRSPEEIASLFDWRPNRVWYWVDGKVDSTEFEEAAVLKAASVGPSFNRIRWFCGDEELLYSDGKTYAFSNQWGGSNWHRAMTLLKEHYPQFRIEFTPTK